MNGSSKRKGRRGELEVRNMLRTIWKTIERTPMSGGHGIKGDMYNYPKENKVHIEVKIGKSIRYKKGWEQAVSQANGKEVWFIHRISSTKESGEWLITLRLRDFLNMEDLITGE